MQFIEAKKISFFYNVGMKNLAFRGIAIFFVLVVATSLMMDVFKMEFGTINFWDKRGVFFLFFIAFFPRLTLLFSSVVSGGFIWWLGFIFCPRILVATLATVAYFHTNPVLVSMSWLIALGGEFFEKRGIGRSRFQFQTFRAGPQGPGPESYRPQGHTPINDSDVIEAEFTKK